MAYFNHAFQKVFWAGSPAGGTAQGYVGAGPVTESVALLAAYGVGAYTFANQALPGWPSVPAAPANGEPLTLVATSLYQNDKIGPFHGGYQETTKSKMVNPKFISDFYYVTEQLPVANIIGIGATPNIDLSLNPECCPEFWCNETYDLRLDLKGSPTLRMLNHNAYEIACAFTGCCDGPDPELVDPGSVMQTWMQYIANDPIFSGMSYAPGFPQQTDNRLVNIGFTNTCDNGGTWDLFLPSNPTAGIAGIYFEADGFTLTAAGIAFQAELEASMVATMPAGFSNLLANTPGDAQPDSEYVNNFLPATPNCCAGLVIQAAFVETQFGDCTFQVTDHFEIEPLQIQASQLDNTGDPCIFEQLCISDGITPSGPGSQTVLPAIQLASQAMGTGEQVLRDLILSESYGQNHFGSNDLRIREITQGYDVTAAVDRNALYGCYYIKHTVPRYNNPSGTFDNDQYLLKIPVDARDIAGIETFMLAWMVGAGNPLGSAPVKVF